MDSVRDNVLIDPTTSVCVNFEVTHGEDGQSVAFFECKTCEELLKWTPVEKYWACSGCGYEMTPPEAQLLLDDLLYKLGYLGRYVARKAGPPAQPKKGWLTWLWGLFSRTQKPRLPAPSSKSSVSD